MEEEEVDQAGEKLFRMGESKDRGLADLEVGSACYMSEMLNFNFEEYDDCDELKEDDLILLNDPFVKQDLKVSVPIHLRRAPWCRRSTSSWPKIKTTS